MPLNTTALDASINALIAETSRTEGTEDSAGVLIAGFSAAIKKAVEDAIAADDAADQGTIDAVNKVIADVTARFVAADDKLGAAVAANGK